MSYNFDFAISAQVSADVIEEMVTSIIEEQTGRKIKSISFKNRTVSDQFDRYSSTVFDGCTVYFEEMRGSNRGPYGDE